VALVVLDASVIIAFLDPDDALHDAAVILVAPYRVGGDAVAEVEAFLSDFGVRLQAITAEVARAAARLRSSSRGLRLPDALVLATADELEAATVLTGDESWARFSDRVSLIQRD
jgi:predicted nucleic acid-binding protein